MMDNKKYKSDLLTFIELLEKHPIEVPIIQRDYAQGRDNQLKIRNDFLDAIRLNIDSNSQMMLDFVYGSMDHGKFQPLDGQQRLTTLYLLHWYACLIDDVPEAKMALLKKFSYETRMTSRDFCRELINNCESLRNNFSKSEILENQDAKISSMIKDSPWFFLSWKSDPTINAILNTLDSIDKKFCGVTNLWNRLDSNRIIQFYYIELEHLGLTDDLYIKMNARGKLLTNFENIKASIEKKVRDEHWEKDKEISDTFYLKLDTVWTDLFWKNFRVDNSIDNSFMRLMAFITMVQLSLDKTRSTESKADTIKSLHDNPNNLTIDMISLEVFKSIENYLDLLVKVYFDISDLPQDLELFRHKPSKDLVNEVLTSLNAVSYTQKVLLFAQLEYFKKVESLNLETYHNWLRVIRNIIAWGDIDQNGKRPDIIRSPQAFIGVINLVSDLSNGCEDIYTYLSDTKNIINSTFAKNQVEEERLKSRLILDDIDRIPLIYALEDTDILRGKLEFIFYCMDFDTKRIEDFDDQLFENTAESFINNLSTEEKINNNLRRALLTIEVDGRYNFYNYWWSFWNVEELNKRKLIDNYREIEYILYSEQKSYIKKLVLSLVNKDIETLLADFIPPEFYPKWKLRLIREEDLLNKSKSYYVAIPENESYCYLLKSIRPRDIGGCIKIE